MILIVGRCDQQYHMKPFCSHRLLSSGPKGSLSVSLCPSDHSSQDAEWQRRLRKQFSLEKCYTLIKKKKKEEKVLHITERNCGYQVLFLPTVIYFICSRSHLSHGQRSSAVSTFTWGVAPTTEQFCLKKTSTPRPLWHYTASGSGFSSMWASNAAWFLPENSEYCVCSFITPPNV